MTADMARHIQTDIETMTRRLELEKRRLHRLERETAVARRAIDVKTGRCKDPQKSGRRTPLGSDGPEEDGARPPPKTGAAPPQSHRFSATPGTSPIAALSSHTAAAAKALAAVEEAEGARLAAERAQGGASFRLLLHRLDISVKRLDGVRHDNAMLQQEIDRLRRGRLQLDGIFERLKIEIRQRSAQLSDVSEETITGLTVQNDAKLRLSVMKRQRESERAAFKEKVMDIRKGLQDYSASKKKLEVRLKRAQDGVQKKRGLIMPPEEKDFCETAMMRRIMKTAFLNCIQRRHIKQHEKTIALFEQAFTTIKQTTGISNIEEIVKIFVLLESKNYSLLTYVNHMNTEIEALEALRLQQQDSDRRRDERHLSEEQLRNHTLGTMRKQLEAKEGAIAEARRARERQQDVLIALGPLLRKLCRRIQVDIERIKTAGGPTLGADLPTLPPELRDEDIPMWLAWAESALGRFRDFIPARDSQEPFPPTARARVLQLAPKRMQAVPAPLVRAQELPLAASFIVDDLPNQKRSLVSPAQKAEILDEEAEEEDFDVRVLPLEDLRLRAQKAASRRRKRTRHHNSEAGGFADRGDFASSGGNDEHGRRGSLANTAGNAAVAAAAAASMLKVPPGADAESIGGPAPLLSEADEEPQVATQSTGRGARLDLREVNISEEELDAAFLQRYKMSKEELQAVADRMGVEMRTLCFLKQEFDSFDTDRSGYIDIGELKKLLQKLGESLSDSELQVAFQDLDSDGSGEIEFFEFAEWFTSA